MMTWRSTIVGAAAAAILALPAHAATVLTDGEVFDSFESGGPGVRFRSQNTGGELYVGSGNLGVAANRVESNVNNYAASQSFTAVWNGVAGSVTGSVGTISQTFTGLDENPFNAVRIFINGPNTRSETLTYFTLTDVTLNGVSVGDFVGQTVSPRTGFTWILTDFGSLTSITLAGTLNYFGDLGANIQAEDAVVNFAFGNVTHGVSVIPLPAAGWLLLGGLAGLGLLARRRETAAA